MKTRILLASAIALAFAAGTIALPSLADAQQFHGSGGHGGGGHGGGGHGGGGHGGGYRMGGAYHGGGYHGGGGAYYGGGGVYYGGVCGPMQVVLGLCGPYGY
jgi:Spy/CpxP family protein refolding chaperone